MTATDRTVILPGNRVARLVEGEEAGEFRLEVSEYLIAHLEAGGHLSPRQVAAARYLAEMYGKGGGKQPWVKGTGGDHEPCPKAWAEYVYLMGAIRAHCTPEARRGHDPRVVGESEMCGACNCARKATRRLLQGDWIVEFEPRPVWRRALDAVADRLGLAEETA
jgi:hypothetical protein